MAIDFVAVEKKFRDYAKSSTGKKKQKDTIKDMVDGKTPAVKGVVTKAQMSKIAEDFIEIFKKNEDMRKIAYWYTDGGKRFHEVEPVSSKSSQTTPNYRNSGYTVHEHVQSILNHIVDMYHTEPIKRPDGSYTVKINFAGNLSRQSLAPLQYPNGLQNIIALMNNGYSHNPIKPAYGYWVSEGDWTSNRRVWEGLHFIESVIKEFNEYIKSQGLNVIVRIAEEYEK